MKMREGTYEAKFVRPNGFLQREIIQAQSKADATKKAKALYEEMKWLETKVIEPSDKEKNKAEAMKEAQAAETGKVKADEKKKREAKNKAKKKKE